MNNQIHELLERAEADKQEKTTVAPRFFSWRYWQEMSVYFWVCSILGHYMEVFWSWVQGLITHRAVWHPIMPSFLPISVPYGFGMVAVLIFVLPIIKKYKANPIIAYLLCSFFCGLVEYICAALIVIVCGHNKYWDYTHQPFNFNGYTSLEASVTFGVIAFIFLFFVYPFCEKYIKRIKSKYLNFFFWFMIVAYSLDLVVFNFL